MDAHQESLTRFRCARLAPTDEPSDWYPKCSGMTGDWGFGRDKTLPASDDKVHLMGTFPFQAAELLSPSGTTVQGVHHDLKLFFWVFWIICVNMTGPFDRRATWIVQEEPLYASANTFEVPEHLLSSTGNCSTRDSSAARREDATKEERDEWDRQAAIPSWAKPGEQGLERNAVARQKKKMDAAILDLISPYFKKHDAVLYGIRHLYRLFHWQKTNVPPPPVTHTAFLAVLHGIIEDIKPEDDPRPSDADIKEARESPYSICLPT
ncbi:hypothetical protein EV401DRAFT_621388 [Pisolithus croceorrhizus]|nr:hypothetical protein EV401DRAFT_621388 [Pisolithus croceorrhizus]